MKKTGQIIGVLIVLVFLSCNDTKEEKGTSLEQSTPIQVTIPEPAAPVETSNETPSATLSSEQLAELNTELDSLSGRRSVAEIKEALIDGNVHAKVGARTVLAESLRQGYTEVASMLIRFGADVSDMTVVDWAALGNTDKVKGFIEGGVDVNSPDASGYFTPLMRATENGHLDVVKLLVENGADLSLGSPLVRACSNGNLAVIQYLVENGADVNDVDAMGGAMPLWSPVRNGRLDIVTFLVENGANVDSGRYDGFTVLMWACEEGHSDVAEYLVSNGANVNAKEFSTDMTPLKYATQSGHTDIIQLLQSAGALE